MKKELRIGLCGFGAMGKTHAFAVSALPYYYSPLPFKATVHGLCTAHPERTRTFCDTYGIPVAAEHEDELIADPSVDIIDICTPNPFHYETALRAMHAGKHVLCEKPLCATAAQAQELAAVAKERGLICGTVFNNRFLAPVLRAQQLVCEGTLGRLLSFRFDYLHNSCLDPTRKVGWKQTAAAAGGTLMDLGPHILDLCTCLCGSISSLFAVGQIGIPTHENPDGTVFHTDADESVYMTLTMQNGATGMLCASKLCIGENDGLTFALYGTEGALKFDLMEPSWLYFYNKNALHAPIGGNAGFTRIECVGRYPAPGGIFPSPKAPDGWLRGHIGSMYAYLSAVACGTPFTPSFADGAYVQKLIDAAATSMREGRTVSLA